MCMNFVALIGIVENIELNNNITLAKIKVEKNSEENDENWYDLIEVEIPNQTFSAELKEISHGDIVGVKGRISTNKNVLCERLQKF